MDRKLKVGDYLRYTRYAGLELDPPMWAVVTFLQLGGTQGRAAVLLRSNLSIKFVTFDRLIRSSERTARTDHAPGEIPDEVVAEEARRALLGVRHG